MFTIAKTRLKFGNQQHATFNVDDVKNLIVVNRFFGRSFVDNYISLVNNGEFSLKGGRNFPVISDVHVCESSRIPNSAGGLIDGFFGISISGSSNPSYVGLENGRTLIPEGLYEVDLTFSHKFQRDLPILLDVPSRDGIRIHPGNYAKNSSGCILLGLTSHRDYIQSSVYAVNEIVDYLRCLEKLGEKTYIFVTNNYQLQ